MANDVLKASLGVEQNSNRQNMEYPRRDIRIPSNIECTVRVGQRTLRRLVIANYNKRGLLLKGSPGTFLRVNDGEKAIIEAEIGGQKVQLVGVIVRSKSTGVPEIGIKDLEWYRE